MSHLPQGIFREYDIRGLVERDLTDDVTRRIARAFAAKLRERGGGNRVVVGRDCRLSSKRLRDDFVESFAGGGFEVTDLGVCPTPLVYFALHRLDPVGGVQITGSHNPANYNGFKLAVGKATIWGDEIQQLRRETEADKQPEPGEGSVDSFAVIPAYKDFVRENTPLDGTGMRIVIDAGNGTGGFVAAPLFESMGFDVVRLYCDMDGRFPNHHPDPTVPANLQDLIGKVKETGAAIGIAYDGDADRIGAVDGQRNIFFGDQLLTIFARDILSRNPGAAIVGEVKCSQLLYKDIAAHGGRPIMWRTGHSILKQKLKDEGALLAGEMSGHMFFKERYFGYDDGIYAYVRLIEILQNSGGKASELLADLPKTYTTPEIRVECADAKKFEVVKEVIAHFQRDHEVITIDGARIVFPPDAWGLVRASNTQPALVLRFEANSPETLHAIRQEVEAGVAMVREKLGA